MSVIVWKELGADFGEVFEALLKQEAVKRLIEELARS